MPFSFLLWVRRLYRGHFGGGGLGYAIQGFDVWDLGLLRFEGLGQSPPQSPGCLLRLSRKRLINVRDVVLERFILCEHLLADLGDFGDLSLWSHLVLQAEVKRFLQLLDRSKLLQIAVRRGFAFSVIL